MRSAPWRVPRRGRAHQPLQVALDAFRSLGVERLPAARREPHHPEAHRSDEVQRTVQRLAGPGLEPLRDLRTVDAKHRRMRQRLLQLRAYGLRIVDKPDPVDTILVLAERFAQLALKVEIALARGVARAA